LDKEALGSIDISLYICLHIPIDLVDVILILNTVYEGEEDRETYCNPPNLDIESSGISNHYVVQVKAATDKLPLYRAAKTEGSEIGKEML